MVGRPVNMLRSVTLGLALIAAACVDPFHPDTQPVPAPSGGPPPPSNQPPSNQPPSNQPPGNQPPSNQPPGNQPIQYPDAAVPVPPPRADAGAPVDKPLPAPVDASRPDAPAAKTDAPPPPEKIVMCPPEPETAPPGDDLTCPDDPKILQTWLPNTPPISGCKPLPHPARECLFYQFAWQNFLLATQPDAAGQPAFLSWHIIENTFGAGAGQPNPPVPILTGGVTQAGGRQVVVDQKGHAIYYGIHFNQPFVDFVKYAGLTDAAAISAADPNLAFPTTTNIVELKTAWMIVDDANPPANFITTKAKVSTLKVGASNTIVEDRTALRDVTVALIAMHVVYTLPGHPEFIWSSFQHVDAAGVPDVAPSAPTLPPRAGFRANQVISPKDHLLYKGGTPVSGTNKGVLNGPMFDEATQTFAVSQISNIFRVFPGSKSTDPVIDDDVSAITDNMIALFKAKKATLPPADKRPNYFLVGAIWQDQPGKNFKLNQVLVNPANIGPDNPASITGGEDTMSSTAMESFTQNADAFPNCFTCHDTRAATATGVPAARDMNAAVTLQPKMINVSHVFNEVVREGL
jgi:hypothetical protein